MNTPHNESQAKSNAGLAAVSQPAPMTTPEAAKPNATAANMTYSPQPDLADQARLRRTQGRIRTLLVLADYQMKYRVPHPDGGESPVDEILRYEAAQRAKIDGETGDGSRKHLRLPRWIRWIPKYVLAFDFCLLLYFFAGITNVDWSSAPSMALAFAAVLAAMVTVLSYGFLAFTGHRLRNHKNHAGTVHHDELDGFTKVILVVAIAVIVIIATLMFLRMRTEVLYALGAQAGMTALVIAVALATVSAAANFLVIAIQALDGSDQTARLDQLSATARRHIAKMHRMRERAARQADQ